MTDRIYKVSCIDGRLYLNHHGVSDYVGDEDCTNEKAIIQIGQYLNELTHENEELKQFNNEAIELILDGIVEMHDGKRDYAETIFNKAIKLLKSDVE